MPYDKKNWGKGKRIKKSVRELRSARCSHRDCLPPNRGAVMSLPDNLHTAWEPRSARCSQRGCLPPNRGAVMSIPSTLHTAWEPRSGSESATPSTLRTAWEPRSGDVVDNPCRGSAACGATEPGGKRDYKKGMSRGARDVVWTTLPPPSCLHLIPHKPHKDNIAAPQLRGWRCASCARGFLAARRSARVIHNHVAPRLRGSNRLSSTHIYQHSSSIWSHGVAVSPPHHPPCAQPGSHGVAMSWTSPAEGAQPAERLSQGVKETIKKG